MKVYRIKSGKHVNLEVKRTYPFVYPSREPRTLTDPQKPQSIAACPDLSKKEETKIDLHLPKNNSEIQGTHTRQENAAGNN